jgi:hypothetical protein
MVPSKTPVESMEPEPLKATPPAPVVGAAEFCGFKRILQSAQVAANPPPVTVNVAPRAAVVGENFENAVIAVIVEAVTAVVSPEAEVFTVSVLVAVDVSAACAVLGLTIPAACVNVITKLAPTPPADAAIPLSPVDVAESMSGTVMVTARPSTVTSPAEFSRPAVPLEPLTTAAFSLIADEAIDDGTVNFEPNVTVMVPPTGTAEIPALLDPVTVIVY